jgi:hypothetical protein
MTKMVNFSPQKSDGYAGKQNNGDIVDLSDQHFIIFALRFLMILM